MIGGQNALLIAIYKDVNMKKLEDCLNRLSTAMERFKVSLFMFPLTAPLLNHRTFHHLARE